MSVAIDILPIADDNDETARLADLNSGVMADRQGVAPAQCVPTAALGRPTVVSAFVVAIATTNALTP
jgi:hypothetical protein